MLCWTVYSIIIRYIPSARECPLYLQLPDGRLSKTNAFISPVSGTIPSCKKLFSFCYPSCYLLDSIILLHRCGEVFLSGTHRTAYLIPRRLMVPGRKCHLRYGFYHFIASLISWHAHMQRSPFQVFKYPFCKSIICWDAYMKQELMENLEIVIGQLRQLFGLKPSYLLQDMDMPTKFVVSEKGFTEW